MSSASHVVFHICYFYRMNYKGMCTAVFLSLFEISSSELGAWKEFPLLFYFFSFSLAVDFYVGKETVGKLCLKKNLVWLIG